MLSRNSQSQEWLQNAMLYIMKCKWNAMHANIGERLQQVVPRLRQRCHVLQVCLPRTRWALKASTNTSRRWYIQYNVSQIWRSSMFKLVQTFKKSESQESRTHIKVPPLHICQASHVKQTPGSVRQFVKIKHKQVKLTQKYKHSM